MNKTTQSIASTSTALLLALPIAVPVAVNIEEQVANPPIAYANSEQWEPLYAPMKSTEDEMRESFTTGLTTGLGLGCAVGIIAGGAITAGAMFSVLRNQEVEHLDSEDDNIDS